MTNSVRNHEFSDEDEERVLRRFDINGVQIKKGNKSHRIMFADTIKGQERPLTQIYLVESYKKYNRDMSRVPADSCCTIF